MPSGVMVIRLPLLILSTRGAELLIRKQNLPIPISLKGLRMLKTSVLEKSRLIP